MLIRASGATVGATVGWLVVVASTMPGWITEAVTVPVDTVVEVVTEPATRQVLSVFATLKKNPSRI